VSHDDTLAKRGIRNVYTAHFIHPEQYVWPRIKILTSQNSGNKDVNKVYTAAGVLDGFQCIYGPRLEFLNTVGNKTKECYLPSKFFR